MTTTNITRAYNRYEKTNANLRKLEKMMKARQLSGEWEQTLSELRSLVASFRKDVIAEERMAITRIAIFTSPDHDQVDTLYVRGYLRSQDLGTWSKTLLKEAMTNLVSIEGFVIVGDRYIDNIADLDLDIETDIIYPDEEEYLDIIRDEYLFFSTPDEIEDALRSIWLRYDD